MTAEPPDRPNLRQPNTPESATSDVGKRRPWPPAAILWPWLGVNTLGFAIVTIILIAVAGETTGGAGMEALSFSGVVVRSLISPMQAFILRNQVPRLRIWQWILASMVGGYLGIFLGAIAFLATSWMMWAIDYWMWMAWMWMASPIMHAAQLSISGAMMGQCWVGSSCGLGSACAGAAPLVGGECDRAIAGLAQRFVFIGSGRNKGVNFSESLLALYHRRTLGRRGRADLRGGDC